MTVAESVVPVSQRYEAKPIDYPDRNVWVFTTTVSTLIVFADSGAILPSVLWFLGMSLFGFVALPRIHRSALRWTEKHDNLWLDVPLGWALVAGPVIGAVFGVGLPWIRDWTLSPIAGGLLGLIIGPCFAAMEGLAVLTLFKLGTWAAKKSGIIRATHYEFAQERDHGD